LYLVTFLPTFQESDGVELDYTWFELYEENGGRTHVGPDGLGDKLASAKISPEGVNEVEMAADVKEADKVEAE
jgi:hypothetical protein